MECFNKIYSTHIHDRQSAFTNHRGIHGSHSQENGGFRGIGILDSIWKVVAYIIKGRLQKVIKFHPSVHSFVREKRTLTAIIEQQLWMKLKKELQKSSL